MESPSPVKERKKTETSRLNSCNQGKRYVSSQSVSIDQQFYAIAKNLKKWHQSTFLACYSWYATRGKTYHSVCHSWKIHGTDPYINICGTDEGSTRQKHKEIGREPWSILEESKLEKSHGLYGLESYSTISSHTIISTENIRWIIKKKKGRNLNEAYCRRVVKVVSYTAML